MKKYLKKIASFVLVSGMLLSGVSGSLTLSARASDDEIVTDNEEEVHIWDGTSDVNWYDDEETEFHISTAEQLAGLSEIVNTGKTMEGKTIILDNDIYLNDVSDYDNWSTNPPENMFRSLKEFSGSFLGANHSIIGLYLNDSGFFDDCGFFTNITNGYVSEVNLMDLYISLNSTINPSSVYSGGLICRSKNSSIINCSAEGIIDSNLINDLSYKDKLQYDKYHYLYLGGLIGLCESSKVMGCTNSVNITSNSKNFDNEYIGGICGWVNSPITNCTNNGNVKSETISSVYVGGICGTSGNVITNCKNHGETSAYGEMGCFYGYQDGGRISITPKNGGICGRISGRILNCYNTGKIQGGSYVGGICGDCSDNVRIENVYNVGDITDGYAISGLNGKALISNAYYLTGTALKGSYVYGSVIDTTITKTEANMKKESFADSLGEAFYYVEGSYPKLAFEVGRTLSNFDKTSLSFKEYGETQTLTLDTTYLGEPEWISSDTSVATVDTDGVVTAVGNGTAMIYALCSDSKAVCSVSVGYDYYLSDNELSLKKGRVHDLVVYSTSDNKEVTDIEIKWSSSDDSIVSVNGEGTITTNGKGIAVITATLADVELSCIVVVYEYTVPVTPVENDENAPKLSETDFTISTIESKLLSVENYSESITWTSANTSIAKVSKNGLVKGVSEGNTAIYALLSDGRCLKANAVITESEYTIGDVNLDGEFNVSDVVLLQKWLLAVPDIELKYWENADFYEDGKLNVFDLCLMKRQIINAVK